jgi:hypothetical protein
VGGLPAVPHVGPVRGWGRGVPAELVGVDRKVDGDREAEDEDDPVWRPAALGLIAAGVQDPRAAYRMLVSHEPIDETVAEQAAAAAIAAAKAGTLRTR